MSLNWKSCTTLSETVYRLINEGKADSSEFEALVNFHGHEKLKKLYDQESLKHGGSALEGEVHPEPELIKADQDTLGDW